MKTLCFNEKNMELLLVNQTLLPNTLSYFTCKTTQDVIFAMQTMVVRGAPAIGVAAGFGCVLAANESLDAENWLDELNGRLTLLEAARPTAVNLMWAVSRMRALLEAKQPETCLKARDLLLTEALRMEAQDITICKKLGRNGAALLKDGDCVLTHCNAGALATAAYGTALGVIRAAVEEGKKITVIADETRPLLQGARLTSFDRIPVTVACDNACALLMSQGRVDSVIVGADRIAENGDTANKIGTFGVAIIAKHFNIPFYVAAPLSTIDRSLPDGSLIPIEERSRDEVASFAGKSILPQDVPAVNFAFDVTPAELISAIITEEGVLTPPYAESIAQAFSARS